MLWDIHHKESNDHLCSIRFRNKLASFEKEFEKKDLTTFPNLFDGCNMSNIATSYGSGSFCVENFTEGTLVVVEFSMLAYKIEKPGEEMREGYLNRLLSIFYLGPSDDLSNEWKLPKRSSDLIFSSPKRPKRQRIDLFEDA